MSTLDRRTALLVAGAAPVALLVRNAGAVPAKPPADPLPALVARYIAATDAFVAAAYAPGGENMDSPECEAAAAEREALCPLIANAIPTTPSAAAAQLEWLDVDSNGGELVWPLYVTAVRNCAAGLRAMGGTA